MMSTFAQTTLRELEQVTRMYRANVLVIGDIRPSDRDEVLNTVKRHTGRDLFHAQRAHIFDLPSDRGLTDGGLILVLDDACQLSRNDQLRLLEWVGRNRVPIVSFASGSLYDMVCEQTFIDRLYYHLNTVCVIAEDIDSKSRGSAQGA